MKSLPRTRPRIWRFRIIKRLNMRLFCVRLFRGVRGLNTRFCALNLTTLPNICARHLHPVQASLKLPLLWDNAPSTWYTNRDGITYVSHENLNTVATLCDDIMLLMIHVNTFCICIELELPCGTGKPLAACPLKQLNCRCPVPATHSDVLHYYWGPAEPFLILCIVQINETLPWWVPPEQESLATRDPGWSWIWFRCSGLITLRLCPPGLPGTRFNVGSSFLHCVCCCM